MEHKVEPSGRREFLLGRGFSPIGRETYPVFKAYDTGIHQFHELTATVSTIWAFGFDAIYKIIDGFLCSAWFYRSGELYFYIQRPPGAGPAADSGPLRRLIAELCALARGAALDALRIWAVDETLLAELRAAGADSGSFSAECSVDYSEYLYRTADILEWDGGVNLNKRNSLKRCFNTPNVSLRPLSGDNFARCFEVEDEWCRHQDCDACRAFAGCARDSLKNMGEIFDPLVYGGLLLYVAGKPEGYAIWELLGQAAGHAGQVSPEQTEASPRGTAYVYFAKANITNFNVYLYYSMAKDHLGGSEFLNNGYDMGKPGLRTFKRHLGVHRMMKKYLVTLA
ncbi:MAG: phosphatidylglycerol lysyltransferase domain-containing protein, partial [Treponema sp.]|nr:phosphatidylglycerol lysyltransferase domain-containing protein [Treponema sp.]